MRYWLGLLLLLSLFLCATSCTKKPAWFSRNESKAHANTQTKHHKIPRQNEPPTTKKSPEIPADIPRQNPQLSQEKNTAQPAKKITHTKRSRRTQPAKKPQKSQRALSKKTSQKTPEPTEQRYYASLEGKLRKIRREIEEGGYILDEANNPKVVKKNLLKTYDGFRLTFKAKERRHLPVLERKVEKDLEERYAKNFRRIYRGKMSKIQEGIYVVDFIPQEHLQTYKKNELNMP